MNEDIKTKRTLLRKYTERDREAMVKLSIDPEVNHFIGGRCETEEAANTLFDKGLEVYDGLFPNRHFEIWAIESDGKLIGHFELKQSDNTEESELEIVYLLDKNYWGRGIMPEVICEINKYAASLGKQLIATINPENTKTVKALQKTGIEKEGWVGEEDDKAWKLWLKRYKI